MEFQEQFKQWFGEPVDGAIVLRFSVGNKVAAMGPAAEAAVGGVAARWTSRNSCW